MTEFGRPQPRQAVDEQPRDRFGRPLIHVPSKDKLVAYTRATTFIDAIEDRSSLERWQKRMVLIGATRDPDGVRLAGNLDPANDKKQLNSLADRLVEAAGAHDKRNKGSHLHYLSECVDRGEPLPNVLKRPGRPSVLVTEQDRQDMAGYMLATMDLEMVQVEQLVVVDDMLVAGTPDRVSRYDGPGPGRSPGAPEYAPDSISGSLIVDLKTGNKAYGALKRAMQLALYSRGQSYDWRTQERTPLPDVNQDWGLIVHLLPGGGSTVVEWIDLRIGWQAVKVARQVRELRRVRSIEFPLQISM